ncbi:hypothetical protein GGS23DRAFT_596858 [Durotheca rogersii]|uniref:uncharacterized protein n=1 Tax=Durotheca rogersii TaxID=419775 RepID=UPI002220397A|nr:uncharacterized protein GGS23DRAFT_596858 [Durotheca rogersii]KAI5863090.1 hypothetical protein GGS23DRAFT_596858 [Durotheca rogersii]
MERDVRRDRSQWRGCHTFNNIICDGDQVGNPKRSGGLKMGQTYYYYYEVDGITEMHDPSKPTTNACPYLPGQTVNALEVPLEHPLSRLRSASMNSLRITDYKTMNPGDKFVTPRPAPPVPSLPDLRVGSSPVMSTLAYSRSARSLSPAPRWTRRFFGRRRAGHGHGAADADASSETEGESACGEDSRRSATPSGSVRSRDMSPESLRRFLSDDRPLTPPTAVAVDPAPKLSIPDEIAEENEDDDNFASLVSAASENAPVTQLSPPPFQRSAPAPAVPRCPTRPPPTPRASDGALPESFEPRPRAATIEVDIPRSRFSLSTAASPTSPQSAESRDRSQYSFFDDSEDSDDDDDDEVLSNADESFVIQGTREEPSTDANADARRSVPKKHAYAPFTGCYRLPSHPAHLQGEKPLDATRGNAPAALGSPDLLARIDGDGPLGNAGLLSRPGLDAGLDDLVNDMGWMADVIQPKYV